MASAFTCLTLEERERIQKYISIGISTERISKLIEKHKSSLNRELRINGGRQKYNAKMAQESAEYKKANKLNYFKQISQTKIEIEGYIKRIENLEFQIEILLEEIKLINQKLKEKNV